MKPCYVLPIALAWIPGVVMAAPFGSIQPGYEQQVYAVNASQLSSFAFAPNGDIWAVQASPNALIRFDSHETQVAHGTSLHPISQNVPLSPEQALSPFVGITNNPDGQLYLAALSQVAVADASTGSVLRTSPHVGSATTCGGTQLASDPSSPSHLWMLGGGLLLDVDPASLTCTDTGGLYWQTEYGADLGFDPGGGGLVMVLSQEIGTAPLSYVQYELRHIGPTSNPPVTQTLLPSQPTGVAVWDGLRQVIVALADGDLYETDVSGGAGSLRLFASGGFPWPLVYVLGPPLGGIVRRGPDGALYALQGGTRYDDGTTTSETSIVRISQIPSPTQKTTWGKLKATYR